MSDQKREPEGQFVKKAETRSAIEVDCSSWVDTSAGGWTFGNFTTLSNTREAVVVDCSHWEKDAAWLELVVSFEASTPPGRVIEHANRLIAAATGAVPELGLTYDLTRSREENGDVVLALAPRNATGTAERLAAVADVIQRATEAVPVRQRVLVRVGRAA